MTDSKVPCEYELSLMLCAPECGVHVEQCALRRRWMRPARFQTEEKEHWFGVRRPGFESNIIFSSCETWDKSVSLSESPLPGVESESNNSLSWHLEFPWRSPKKCMRKCFVSGKMLRHCDKMTGNGLQILSQDEDEEDDNEVSVF